MDSDVSLFVFRRCCRELPIARHLADRQVVAAAGHDLTSDFLDKRRCIIGNHLMHVHRAGGLIGHLDLVDLAQCSIHGVVIHIDDLIALLAIGLLDGSLDRSDSRVGIDDTADLEERRLHDHVDAAAKTEVFSDLDRVNDIELQFLLDDRLLNFQRQRFPDIFGAVQAGQQEGTALLDMAEHIVFFDEARIVTCQEVGFLNQVWSTDLIRAKTQVRHGHGSGLLGVIDEVALCVVVGFRTDDLDAVLVGANRTVRAQAVEHRGKALGGHIKCLIDGQAGLADIILDTDGEVVLRLFFVKIVKDGLDHRR